MQKKNLILLVVLGIAVLILAIVYFSDNKKQNEKIILRDFAVADTASVNKIFLADKNNKTILLERHDEYWTVNEEHKARKDFVDILLETIKRLEVESPVPESKLPKVLRDLSTNGIKAEIYQNDKLVKTYYVGNSDTKGTYMILEGSDVPFLMHIPGFAGFLTIRYTTELGEWRERIVFNYKVQDIAKVEVKHTEDPNESFIIYNYGNNRYNLTDINGNNTGVFDTLKVKEYLARIKFIGFESYMDDNIKQEKLDSIILQPTISEYSIENRQGEVETLKTYYRQNTNNAFQDDGTLYDWDIDHLYGIIKDDKEIVLLQFYIIDPISIKKSSFLRN
ncbi:MAG: DUF4340 domain-containing protein [Bacteroidales bacterium]|jgi:hypothetical protein|nr:DUF4340 domain-containing protein [Bacteroidales bacterium]